MPRRNSSGRCNTIHVFDFPQNNNLYRHNNVIDYDTYLLPIEMVQVADGKGRSSRLSLWSHPGSDVTGMVGRCEKIVGTCEEV